MERYDINLAEAADDTSRTKIERADCIEYTLASAPKATKMAIQTAAINSFAKAAPKATSKEEQTTDEYIDELLAEFYLEPVLQDVVKSILDESILWTVKARLLKPFQRSKLNPDR